MRSDDDPIAMADEEAAEAQRKREANNPIGQSPPKKEPRKDDEAAGIFSQPFLPPVAVTGRAAASGIQGVTAAENF